MKTDFLTWSIVVLDSCEYGRLGLQISLEEYFFSSCGITTQISTINELPGFNARSKDKCDETYRRCLVLRLPRSSHEALCILLKLRNIPRLYYSRIIILSKIEPSLLRNFLKLVGVTSRICILDDRLERRVLCKLIDPENHRITETSYLISEVIDSTSFSPFTHAEYKVLLQTLQGMSMHEQARKAGLVVKTVYCHRLRALNRLRVKNMGELLRKYWIRNDILS